MKELIEAASKMNRILNECERNGDTFDQTLNKITAVKVHGVTFPTLMLIEIIDKFVEDKPKRENRTPDERHVQEGFDRVSAKWMGKTH